MAVSVFERINPIRKPKDFVPAVQRWSVALPNRYDRYFVSFYGVQGADPESVYASGFFPWISAVLALPAAPVAHDHARYVDEQGLTNHIVAMYWIDPAAHEAWRDHPDVAGWWNDTARLNEPCGYFRECMTVPLDRQETLYWQDYPAALSKAAEVSIYPTPWCGYYGAMRDRIPLAAVDPMEGAQATLAPAVTRASKGARWRILTPHNFAAIRSAVYWGDCDPEQHEDFMTKLRAPLETGMNYLRENAGPTGCCSLRYQQTCTPHGETEAESHAIGYFLSLSHLENWAERHPSHHAIFSAAIARYKKYGKANQLRTWHEVYVLPTEGQWFEYVNCTPETGILGYLDGVQLQ
jgi:aldoxime dehydratase